MLHQEPKANPDESGLVGRNRTANSQETPSMVAEVYHSLRMMAIHSAPIER